MVPGVATKEEGHTVPLKLLVLSRKTRVLRKACEQSYSLVARIKLVGMYLSGDTNVSKGIREKGKPDRAMTKTRAPHPQA